MFYWTYAWLDCSEHTLDAFWVNPQWNEEGKKYYGGWQTWAGVPFDDELKLEAEMEVLEWIGLEHAVWLETGKQMIEEEA